MDESDILNWPTYAVMSILMFTWFVAIDWTSDPLVFLAQIVVSASYPIVLVLGFKLLFVDLRDEFERIRGQGDPE